MIGGNRALPQAGLEDIFVGCNEDVSPGKNFVYSLARLEIDELCLLLMDCCIDCFCIAIIDRLNKQEILSMKAKLSK